MQFDYKDFRPISTTHMTPHNDMYNMVPRDKHKNIKPLRKTLTETLLFIFYILYEVIF